MAKRFDDNFEGLFVPVKYMANEFLGLPEMFMLSEIKRICDLEEGQCNRDNDYFAFFFGHTTQRVGQLILVLAEKGFIEYKIDKSQQRRKGERIIKLLV